MTFTYFDRMFVVFCAGAAVTAAGALNLYFPRLGGWRRAGMTAGVCAGGLAVAVLLTRNPLPVAAVVSALMAAVVLPCLGVQAWRGGRPGRLAARGGWAVAVTAGLFAVNNAGARFDADDRAWTAECMRLFAEEEAQQERWRAENPPGAAQ